MFNQLEEISKPPIVEEPPGNPLLNQYLTGRDAACPNCRYNLRDLANGHCPECGEAITLHLQTSGPFARRGTLVLLVFLWLLVASGVQGYLAGRSIHATATNPFARFGQLFTMLNIVNNGNVSIIRNLPVQVTDSTNQLTPNAASGPTVLSAIPNSSVTTPIVRWGSLSGSSSTYNFANVSWQQWTSGGVWAGLFVAAVFGLILLLIIRRRNEASPAMIRSVFILAWSGFGVFCAMHLVSSVLGVF